MNPPEQRPGDDSHRLVGPRGHVREAMVARPSGSMSISLRPVTEILLRSRYALSSVFSSVRAQISIEDVAREPQTEQVDPMNDETPWERARLSLETWERALLFATLDYESFVEKVVEAFERRDRESWFDARECARLGYRRIVGIQLGEREMIERALWRRRSSAQ